MKVNENKRDVPCLLGVKRIAKGAPYKEGVILYFYKK